MDKEYLEKLESMTLQELCEEWDSVMNGFKKYNESLKEKAKDENNKKAKVSMSGGKTFR